MPLAGLLARPASSASVASRPAASSSIRSRVASNWSSEPASAKNTLDHALELGGARRRRPAQPLLRLTPAGRGELVDRPPALAGVLPLGVALRSSSARASSSRLLSSRPG
ncbi:hypothetical protein [Paractinoplanes rishiriensis]|uniref:hypothetical protein n=1 Tax=Paractinoplanes rishiriensis TaxID=1050105 RepID=UPI0019423D93|nr:hypothetical protein [Actinoplanes rishiriensis]